MQGQGLRDRSAAFDAAGVVILGASFDTVADNLVFAEAQGFPYRLLSDTTHAVGAAYEVQRGTGDRYGDFPERLAYLIDPFGTVRVSYEVADVVGFADAVLSDLKELQA